jgi:hypothetical protein
MLSYIQLMAPVLVEKHEKETVGIGNQKKTNYALRADMTEAEFIKEVTELLLHLLIWNECMNKQGYESFRNRFKQWNESHKCKRFRNCC